MLVYAIGTVVTALLSNDATAVVVTPAVFAVVARTNADPLPFLYICAFIANAASFVLPISNPANLVVFDGAMPPLESWLAAFALPSLVAILATAGAHYAQARHRLPVAIVVREKPNELCAAGRVALATVLICASVLVVVAAIGGPVGKATLGVGVLATLIVTAADRMTVGKVLSGITWSVVPLVAGLFVIVAALGRTGLVQTVQAVAAGVDARVPGFASNLIVGARSRSRTTH